MPSTKQRFIVFQTPLILFIFFIFTLVFYSLQFPNTFFFSKASSINEFKKTDCVSKIWDWHIKGDSPIRKRENRNIHLKKNEGFFGFFKKYRELENQTLDIVITLLRLANQFTTKSKEKTILENTEKVFSPLSFIFKKGYKIYTWLQDSHLIEKTLLKTEEIRKNTECAKLVLCKTELFVKGMQKSLIFFTFPVVEHYKMKGGYERKTEDGESKEAEKEAWEKSSPDDKFYFFLPTLERFLESGDACDLRFPLCLY